MILYSGELCVHSHACRIVLFEKGVDCEIQHVRSDAQFEELAQHNPYGETPALLDRDLVLYESLIINEYLDERLPHPPLMPVDPVNRGRARLMITRIQRDWLDLIKHAGASGKIAEDEQNRIRDGLLAVSPVFNEQPFMLGKEYSLVDCYMAALLWRVPMLGVKLPRQAKPILSYAQRLFERPAFASALSEAEREIRLS